MGANGRRTLQRVRRRQDTEEVPGTVTAVSRSSSTAVSRSSSTSANSAVAHPAPTPAVAAASVALALEADEVLAAVQSLYDDELKPFGRILRKRVAERACANTDGDSSAVGDVDAINKCKEDGGISPGTVAFPNVDMKQLRSVCDSCPMLHVEAEEGGDWSVLLVGREPNFVDVYDPEDVYSEELWAEVSSYFGELAGTASQFLPGGRYSCAQALVSRRPKFLAGLSMGRVCHVVQLAISHKKILGYLNGAVVPYECSQSMLKEQKAERQLPYSKPTCENDEMPFATLDTALACLQAILETESTPSSNRSSCMVPLSNIKRLFRSRFHLELSETMLGHSKLSELLQDERFSAVCDVKLAGHGYVVTAKVSDAGMELTPDLLKCVPPGLPPPSSLPTPPLPPPGLAPSTGDGAKSQPPAPPPSGPPRLPPSLQQRTALPSLLASDQTLRAPPGLSAPLGMSTVAEDSEEDDMVPMKVPLPTIHEKSVASFSQQQPRLPTLLGRNVVPNVPSESKSMESKVRGNGIPSNMQQHEYHHRKLLQAHRMQRQMEQQLQEQYHQRIQQQRQQQLLHQQREHLLQQHYRSQDHAALATKRLMERGVDPAVAYAIAAGQAGPIAVGRANVAQLEPAVSSLSTLSDLQTLALSELLPR